MRIDKEVINIKGKDVVFRNATVDDAENLLNYLKITCGETRFLLKDPDEIHLTLDQERDFINRNNDSEGGLLMIAEIDGQHVGNCSLMENAACRNKHRVTLGIALYQKYTGMGIGRAMLTKACQIAKDYGYEQMELNVVANNDRAIYLYTSLGFEVYGKIPNAMKYKDGTYADDYFMMKKL